MLFEAMKPRQLRISHLLGAYRMCHLCGNFCRGGSVQVEEQDRLRELIICFKCARRIGQVTLAMDQRNKKDRARRERKKLELTVP